MEEFMVKFVLWLVATGITVGVIVGFEIAAYSLGLLAIVALIWMVVVWGGFLILDDLDF